ncbi:hypothetical protein Hanom_Chr15g01372081 [Helianthus anomalus]
MVAAEAETVKSLHLLDETEIWVFGVLYFDPKDKKGDNLEQRFGDLEVKLGVWRLWATLLM